MGNVHYFQRYDSKENWITNSTLLLLSRLYHFDRLKFESVVNTILGESNLTLKIGVEFNQQKWGDHSVADGVISQDDFRIVIETKLYDNFTVGQLKRHLDSLIGKSGKRILLVLSKGEVSKEIRNEVMNELQGEMYLGIGFASTTYLKIIETIEGLLAEHEIEMREILLDYIALCEEHRLTDLGDRTLLAFTASTSLNENLRYNIYYDPADRSHNLPFEYVGLYTNKAIVAIGELSKIVYCDLVNGELVATYGTELDLTSDEYNRIKDTIVNTSYYNLQQGNKYFLIKKFYPTNYRKVSFSSLRAKRYFFLEDIDGYNKGMSAEEIAELLNNKTWE